MIKVTAAESSKRSTGKTCELKMSIKSKKKNARSSARDFLRKVGLGLKHIKLNA